MTHSDCIKRTDRSDSNTPFTDNHRGVDTSVRSARVWSVEVTGIRDSHNLEISSVTKNAVKEVHVRDETLIPAATFITAVLRGRDGVCSVCFRS
jgi:hypothetical protein